MEVNTSVRVSCHTIVKSLVAKNMYTFEVLRVVSDAVWSGRFAKLVWLHGVTSQNIVSWTSDQKVCVHGCDNTGFVSVTHPWAGQTSLRNFVRIGVNAYVYLYINVLFNYADNISYYEASHCRMINEHWFGDYVDGTFCGLIRCYPGMTEENHEKHRWGCLAETELDAGALRTGPRYPGEGSV